MTYDQFNTFCRSLPATTHVVQWGEPHVWKVGGKVFAISGWADDEPAFTFKVSPTDFVKLPKLPGLRPAPYFASRGMKWVQHFEQPGLSDEDLRGCLVKSHRLVAKGLTKKKQRELGFLP